MSLIRSIGFFIMGDTLTVIVTKNIELLDYNGPVIIFMGTEIYLDVKEGIAFHNGIHFYIQPDEYAVLN